MNLISCQDLLIMSWICWCNFSPFPKDFQLQVSQVQVWYSSDHWLVLLQGWQMSTRQRRCWMTMQRVVLCATCGLTLSLTSFSPISFSHKILILDELRPEDPEPDKHQSDKHQSDAQPNKLQSQDSHLWWAEVWGSWAWQASLDPLSRGLWALAVGWSKFHSGNEAWARLAVYLCEATSHSEAWPEKCEVTSVVVEVKWYFDNNYNTNNYYSRWLTDNDRIVCLYRGDFSNFHPVLVLSDVSLKPNWQLCQFFEACQIFPCAWPWPLGSMKLDNLEFSETIFRKHPAIWIFLITTQIRCRNEICKEEGADAVWPTSWEEPLKSKKKMEHLCSWFLSCE